MTKKTNLGYKETFQNFIWRAMQIFSKEGITFIIFIITAKLLSPESFGTYIYVFSIILLLVTIGDFGISIATSKFVAEYLVDKKNEIRNIIGNSVIIGLLISLLVSILLILFGKIFFSQYYNYILFTIPLIFLIPLVSIYDGVYRGLKNFKQLSIMSLITGILSILLSYYFIKEYGIYGALLSQIFYYLFLQILLTFNLKTSINLQIKKDMLKTILGYGFLIGIANIGYFLYTRMDLIILGHYNYIDEIGYYEIINKIFQLLIMPVIILATVIAPDSTKTFKLNNVSDLISKLKKESIIMFIAGTIISIISYFIIPILFKIVFTNYDIIIFIQMLTIILFILPFRYFSTLLGIGYITPTGFVKITTITLVFFGVVNIILDIIFIHNYGYIGVIYATLIAQLGYIFSNTLFYYFKLRNLL